MTWLLDGNVLVALRLPSHDFHARARRWFSETSPDPFATCSVTQGTLIRLHMHQASNRSAAAAWRALAEIEAHPRHVYWDDDLPYRDGPPAVLQGPRQITDAWLAQLARRRGARVATLDGPLAALHADVATLLPVF